jgi:membrane-associated protein
VLEPLTDLVATSPWAYLILFGLAAVDALLPLVPSESAAIAAGVLASGGELNVALVLAAAAAGAAAGDTASYAVGRTAGPFASRALFRGGKGPSRRRWAERTLDDRGGYLIVAARFIPGGRTAVTLMAGITQMAWARFVRAASVAAALWASFAVGLGYLGGRVFEDEPWRGLLLAFALAATITLGIEGGRRLGPRRRRRVEFASTMGAGCHG